MGERGPKPAGGASVTKLPERPKPPSGISKRARATWRKIVASMPADYFCEGALPLLRAYCEAEAVHFDACKIIAAEGAVVEMATKTGPRLQKHPAVAIQTAAAGEMATLASKLRLAVSSYRSRESGRPHSKPRDSRRRGLMFRQGDDS